MLLHCKILGQWDTYIHSEGLTNSFTLSFSFYTKGLLGVRWLIIIITIITIVVVVCCLLHSQTGVQTILGMFIHLARQILMFDSVKGIVPAVLRKTPFVID